LRKALPTLRQAFEDAGRNPNDAQVVPVGVFGDKGKLEGLAELGLTEVVLQLPSANESKVLKVLDKYASLVSP
jgi:hypothetical protein